MSIEQSNNAILNKHTKTYKLPNKDPRPIQILNMPKQSLFPKKYRKLKNNPGPKP